MKFKFWKKKEKVCVHEKGEKRELVYIDFKSKKYKLKCLQCGEIFFISQTELFNKKIIDKK